MKKFFVFLSFFLITIYCCKAQLPVSKERRHHNVFENAYIRVLDVHVMPGDTTLFHIHQTPSVFIMLSPVKTGTEVKSEDSNDAKLIGNKTVYFTGFYNKPRIHRVWNSDTAEYHVMDIELVNKNHKKIEEPIMQKGLELLFDEQPARGYELTMNVRSVFEIKRRKAPVLIVGLTDTDAKVNNKHFQKKGDFLFIPPHTEIKFTNKKPPFVRFAVLELK